LKITRRQLRRLIETVVAGTEPGDAVDLETVSTVSSVNQEKYNNVIDSLIKMFPADQASKLSVMLKSDDPENVNMGLALADSLSMSMENEKEIQTLIRRLENISQTVAAAKDFEENPHRPINWGSGSHPIEYPIFEEIEDAIYSVIKDNLGDLFNFAPLTTLNNFNLINSFVDGSLNYGKVDYIKGLNNKIKDSFICPATTQKGVKCGLDCNYCIKGSKPLFIIH